MGLWSRIKRSARALFGGIVEKTENPELILQQTIRDMKDRVPELNNSVAQVMATEKLLAKNKERLESQVVDLDSKIKASVKMGRDDIATAYIGQLQQAQIDLDNNTLVAPFDSIVASITGNPGETAPAGTNGFITLVDPSAVRIDVTVDEADVAKLAVGKPATITFDALPGRPFRGNVISVAPTGTLSQGVVTYPVSINIDSRNQVLPGGMTASATIIIDEKTNVVAVPLRAVRRAGREQVVDVIGADGKPAPRTVRTGVQNDQLVEITDGLQEGEQIAVQGTTVRSGGPGIPGGPGPQRVVIGGPGR